ncbi:MAG: DEAD/DEAH box helicase family protein, partial [Parvularculaceae bacterium]|nr:DEAD/DEAH box helicase family protein [Parvularculaceae bacterium]
MSVFSKLPRSVWVASNALAFAIRDQYPVTEGHTLIITKRVVATWFDATLDEQHAVMALVEEVKADLDQDLSPDGYNVGFNAGAEAGQTVPHLHVHVIPRYKGDMDDPRGGVRHVVPHRGNYKIITADWRRPPGPRTRTPRRSETLITGAPDRDLLSAVKTLVEQAEQVDIVAAFVRNSGLRLIEPMLADLIRRGGHVRVVTGDYLAITEPDALYRLMTLPERAADWSNTEGEQTTLAFERLLGTCETRVIETLVEGRPRSFHPKAWIFSWDRDPLDGVAYVGSSNMSASALNGGVEWNQRVERRLDPVAFDRVLETFDGLWHDARPLTQHWLEVYRKKVETAARNPIIDIEDYAPGEPIEPRDVQLEALEALAATRAEGRRRALIVLATGLGKTFLAAFDIEAFERRCGRAVRVLFIAHRRELLVQAEETLSRVFPTKRFGWFAGDSSSLEGDIVLASIQKLSRRANLKKLHPEAFDYIVVDEVHHAAAASYRRVLSSIEPQFLLGLTATPDRADEADILGLFDDHMPYRADLGEGISRGLLVPFAYKGLKDTTDYAPIPWRSGRFSPAELAAAVQTERRMEIFWEAWKTTPGTRSLIFCASIDHADYVRDWLADRDVKVESVHSRPGSYNRQEALELLGAGALDALCSVDLFNEGIDVKSVDRVVMLRPTESPVVFLQQLGRGLRTIEGKTSLQVIDFVGNHRVFLDRVRTLLSLSERPTTLRAFLAGDAEIALPDGCSIDVELEAVQLLEKLLPSGQGSELVRIYRELRAARSIRPHAGELFRMGLNPASVRKSARSWFGFVSEEGDLTEAETRAFAQGELWLSHLEKTAMSKSFKMVVLQVLAEADALQDGMAIPELARRSHALIARNPALLGDLRGVKALKDILTPDPDRWERYWRTNPIQAWTKPNRNSRAWFAIEDNTFVSKLPFPIGDEEAAQALADMTLELIDWRMAIYRQRRTSSLGQVSTFDLEGRLHYTNQILRFGPRHKQDRLPHG